jgi:hypothetical protein
MSETAKGSESVLESRHSGSHLSEAKRRLIHAQNRGAAAQ